MFQQSKPLIRINAVLRRRAGATGLAMALLLTACGSGDNADSTAATAPTVGASATADEAPTTAPAVAAEDDTPEAPAATEVPSTDEPEPSADGSASSATTEAAAEAPTDPPAVEVDIGENQLPDVMVLDIATGEDVNLRSFAPADTPIVLWFWAPH